MFFIFSPHSYTRPKTVSRIVYTKAGETYHNSTWLLQSIFTPQLFFFLAPNRGPIKKSWGKNVAETFLIWFWISNRKTKPRKPKTSLSLLQKTIVTNSVLCYKGSTNHIHAIYLNFVFCAMNSSGSTISVWTSHSARHLIVSNLTVFGKIYVLYFEQMMQVLYWVRSWWRVGEQMFSYPQYFLGQEHLIMKVPSLNQPSDSFYRRGFSKRLTSELPLTILAFFSQVLEVRIYYGRHLSMKC